MTEEEIVILNNDNHYVYIDTVFLHLENLEGVLSQKVSNLIFIIKHAYLYYIHTNICNPFFPDVCHKMLRKMERLKTMDQERRNRLPELLIWKV